MQEQTKAKLMLSKQNKNHVVDDGTKEKPFKIILIRTFFFSSISFLLILGGDGGDRDEGCNRCAKMGEKGCNGVKEGRNRVKQGCNRVTEGVTARYRVYHDHKREMTG